MTTEDEELIDSVQADLMESRLNFKPWKPGTRKINYSTGQSSIFDGVSWQVLPMGQFTVGGTVLSPSVKDIYVWTALYDCTVLNVKAYQDVGTGSTFNAFSGSLASPVLLLASNATIGSTDVLVDGGAVQNASITKGTNLYVRVASVVGSPTQIAIRIYITR